MEKPPYIHALPVRIWHWLNALGFLLLILSGTQIRYSDLLSIMSFETAVHFHNYVGFAVMINWMFWFSYHLYSPQVQNYHADLDFKEFSTKLIQQVKYYAVDHFTGGERPHDVKPFDKFNPMQKVSYLMVMFFSCIVTFATGLMMWSVDSFSGAIQLAGGIRVVNTLHVLMYALFLFFIPVHIYMGFLGRTPLSHYKEMITGYEDE